MNASFVQVSSVGAGNYSSYFITAFLQIISFGAFSVLWVLFLLLSNSKCFSSDTKTSTCLSYLVCFMDITFLYLLTATHYRFWNFFLKNYIYKFQTGLHFFPCMFWFSGVKQEAFISSLYSRVLSLGSWPMWPSPPSLPIMSRILFSGVLSTWLPEISQTPKLLHSLGPLTLSWSYSNTWSMLLPTSDPPRVLENFVPGAHPAWPPVSNKDPQHCLYFLGLPSEDQDIVADYQRKLRNRSFGSWHQQRKMT